MKRNPDFLNPQRVNKNYSKKPGEKLTVINGFQIGHPLLRQDYKEVRLLRYIGYMHPGVKILPRAIELSTLAEYKYFFGSKESARQ